MRLYNKEISVRAVLKTDYFFEDRLFYPISLWSKISDPEQRAISTANYIIQFKTGIKVSHFIQRGITQPYGKHISIGPVI